LHRRREAARPRLLAQMIAARKQPGDPKMVSRGLERGA
jgi:hypothetical protein